MKKICRHCGLEIYYHKGRERWRHVVGFEVCANAQAGKYIEHHSERAEPLKFEDYLSQVEKL